MMCFILNEEAPFQIILFTEYFLYQTRTSTLEELKKYRILFSFKKNSYVDTNVLNPKLEKICINKKFHSFEKLIQQLCLKEGKK